MDSGRYRSGRIGRMPRVFAILWQSVGHCLYWCMPGVRKRVENNMQSLLPELPATERKSAVKRYFSNLAVALAEIVFDAGSLQHSGLDRFHFHNEHELRRALAEGRGVIVLTPHLGNFFYAYWALSRKYDCVTVATSSDPELQPLYQVFERLGCKGYDYNTVPPLQLIRALRRHLAGNGVIMMMGDFYRPQFPESVWFGRKTRTPQGTVMLALEQRVPVVPMYVTPGVGRMQHLHFMPPIRLYEQFGKGQRTEATYELNQILEKIIKRHPDLWFYWFNVEERFDEKKD